MDLDYDILALDVDGTLLDTSGRLSPGNAAAVREARRAGMMVLLASARSPLTILELARVLDLDAPTPRPAPVWKRPSSLNNAPPGAPWPAIAINFNGAVVWSFTARRAISHTPLDGRLAASVIAAARSIDAHALVAIEHIDRVYTDCADPEQLARILGDAALDATSSPLRNRPPYIGPVSGFSHIAPSRLTLLLSEAHANETRRLLMDEYAAPGLISCRSTGVDRIEVQSPGVDKSEALCRIAASLGVPIARVAAVGDGPNDASMLKAVGLGLAVANAWGEARTAADRILTRGSDHDPLTEALEYILRGPRR